MVPTTAALAEPTAADHADRARSEHRGLRDQLPRAAGKQPHHVDHGALRVEAVAATPASSRKAAISVSASWP